MGKNALGVERHEGSLMAKLSEEKDFVKTFVPDFRPDFRAFKVAYVHAFMFISIASFSHTSCTLRFCNVFIWSIDILGW